MMIKNKKLYKSTLLFCLFIIFETIFLKCIIYKILPDKYFYDSIHILNVMNGSNITDKSYTLTANIFNAINIFGFKSITQWGWFLGGIFSIIIVILLLRNKKYTISQYIFIYSSIALLNIYVFGVSKDLIQLCLFLIIYLILLSKISNAKKIILITIIFALEAYFFRIYYLLMAILMITIYVIYIAFIKDKKIDKKNIVKIIVIAILAFFLEVFILQLISTESYNELILARSNVNQFRENSTDAVTMITELLGTNTSYFKFIGNYIINAIRITVPIELILKGVKYLPFIIYQLFITVNIFKISKKINYKNILWVIVVISFLMVSIIFEADFGSVIRHESVIFLIILQLNLINNRKEIKNE